jgi:hypothetical protein
MAAVINETALCLTNNFLFQASLGSKELFHSNMLAWLLEQESANGRMEAFHLFLNQFIGKGLPELDSRKLSFEIQREQLNIDLIIKWQDQCEWKMVFIENKMKSIPTREQLADYDAKIDKLDNGKRKLNGSEVTRKAECRILLTPLALNRNDVLPAGWVNKTYEDDVIVFLETLANIRFKNEDVPFVIDRYRELIKNLIRLLSEFKLDNDGEFGQLNYVGVFYPLHEMEHTDTAMVQVRNLRLHDLVLKLTHQKIAQQLRSQFSGYSTELVDSYETLKKKPQSIHISDDFSRSTGITGCIVHVKDGFHIGIQLQANSVKYFVEVFDNKLNEKNRAFAFKLVEKCLWFYDNTGDEPRLLDGKGRNKKQLSIDGTTVFNSYGLNFIYLKRDVPDDFSMNNVVELMRSEIQRVKDNLGAYEEVLDSIK